MITELRKKSQVTIPKELVVKLGLKEGDKLEVIEQNGAIQIVPVAVYPRKYLEDLKEEIGNIKARMRSGEQPMFDTVDELFAELDGNDR